MRWHYKEIEKRKGVRYNGCRSVTNPPTKNRKVSLLGTGGISSIHKGFDFMNTRFFILIRPYVLSRRDACSFVMPEVAR